MTKDEQRIADLTLALDYCLLILGELEPPHSAAVSDEFVAMAAISCGIEDRIEECRDILVKSTERVAELQNDPERIKQLDDWRASQITVTYG